MDIAGLSDTGLIRQINEDALLIAADLDVYAIADGMGGHGAGDVASQLALSSVHDTIKAQSLKMNSSSAASTHGNSFQKSEAPHAEFEQQLVQAILDANLCVYDRNVEQGHPHGTGMGTTLVGFRLVENDDEAVCFNVGDSRLYEYRQGTLVQLTNDHTLHQDWLNSGKQGPEPPRNIILRAVGLFAEVEADIFRFKFHRDATYLLCSDGLSGMLSDDTIAANLQDAAACSQEICQQLVDLANDAGGVDNISVVILRTAAPGA